MIWNPEIETMPRSDMERLQTERLRAVVERTYHRVAPYRELMDAAGVKPEDIRSLADLPRLPFMTKSMMREQYPYGLFAEPPEKLVRLHASSGTKGKPTLVGYTRNDIDVWAEVCARSFCLSGGEPGHVFQNAYGYGLFTGGLGLHYGVERAGGVVVPASTGGTPRQLLLLQDLQPHGMCCTPSYLLTLLDHMENAGIDSRNLSVRYGILGAEPWSESMRREIEERTGMHAVDIYGLSEVVGPGVANECWEAKDGLHIAEDHFYPEVIDPDTGEPLPFGEYGELVITTLTKEAIPVIRYRTGDIAALIDGKCKCGRTTVRMTRVKGRADDMLIVRGVNVFPSEVEYQLLQLEGVAPHYQIAVDRTGTLDSLEVVTEPEEDRVKAWGGFDENSPHVSALANEIAERLRAALVINVNVRLVPPGTVPRSEGKAVRVIDRRQTPA